MEAALTPDLPAELDRTRFRTLPAEIAERLDRRDREAEARGNVQSGAASVGGVAQVTVMVTGAAAAMAAAAPGTAVALPALAVTPAAPVAAAAVALTALIRKVTGNDAGERARTQQIAGVMAHLSWLLGEAAKAEAAGAPRRAARLLDIAADTIYGPVGLYAVMAGSPARELSTHLYGALLALRTDELGAAQSSVTDGWAGAVAAMDASCRAVKTGLTGKTWVTNVDALRQLDDQLCWFGLAHEATGLPAPTPVEIAGPSSKTAPRRVGEQIESTVEALPGQTRRALEEGVDTGRSLLGRGLSALRSVVRDDTPDRPT